MSLLGWALMFLAVALVAALFGFTNIAAGAVSIARVLFGIFLLIFIVILVLSFMGVGAVATAS